MELFAYKDDKLCDSMLACSIGGGEVIIKGMKMVGGQRTCGYHRVFFRKLGNFSFYHPEIRKAPDYSRHLVGKLRAVYRESASGRCST